jgi:hypothetical protein
MQVGAAAAVVLLSVIASPAHAWPADVSADQLTLFAELLESAKRLPDGRESAAFLVRDSEHGLYLIRWPQSATSRQSTYSGRLPTGVIAIAHTHPELTHLRMPSSHDAALARHSGLDVYVITHAEIWLAQGVSGRVVRVVCNGSWSAMRVSRPAVRQPRVQVASSPARSRTRDILRSRAADE